MQTSLAGAARDETGGTGSCVYAAGRCNVLDHWKKQVWQNQWDSDLKPAIGKYQITLTPKWISYRQLSKNRGDVISSRISWSCKSCYLCLQSTALPGASRGFAHSRAFLPCRWLTREGKTVLVHVLLMSFARWPCSWRGEGLLTA